MDGLVTRHSSLPKRPLEHPGDMDGLALVTGGALGNVIDRMRFGCVVDYLDFYILDKWPHWPAFNVADSAISIGAVILILEGFVHHEKRAGAPS